MHFTLQTHTRHPIITLETVKNTNKVQVTDQVNDLILNNFSTRKYKKKAEKEIQI